MRRYFLWDSLQPRFVTVSLCYVWIVGVAVAAVLFLPIMSKLDHLSPSSDEAPTVADQFLWLHNRFWPTVIVVCVLLVIHGTFFSHRIAGPLYRFRRIFRDVASGDLTVKTTIRKGDYLQAEAECLGLMVNALRDRIARIETHRAAIIPQLERVRQAAARGACCEVEQETERLRRSIEDLSHSMESFRTETQVPAGRADEVPTASGF
jgi:methyl-accepting chemotaxis protein